MPINNRDDPTPFSLRFMINYNIPIINMKSESLITYFGKTISELEIEDQNQVYLGKFYFQLRLWSMELDKNLLLLHQRMENQQPLLV